MKATEKIEVSMRLTNTGEYAGEEVVQLYIRDKVGSVVRPVKELKDFQKIKLDRGESKILRFIIDREKLSFFNDKLQWIAEPGEFDLMIGSSSEDIRLKDVFELIK
jgi:beta-glucosidase